MVFRQAVIVAAILLALPSLASAAPKHRHHHRHVTHATQAEIVCDRQGCRASTEVNSGPASGVSHRREKPGNAPAVSFSGFGGDLVARARAELGKTAAQLGLRRSLWCSAFLRKLTGQDGVDDRAKSWLARPRTSPHVGAIAVVRGGHHVGVVSGFDANGNPILISGNHSHRVGEGVYPRRTVLAYVEP